MKLPKLTAIAAAFVAALTFTLWANGGFHKGWSQTQIPEEQIDEITGIEYVVYTEGFRPGIDFLAAGTLTAVLLLVLATFLAYRQNRKAFRSQTSAN